MDYWSQQVYVEKTFSKDRLNVQYRNGMTFQDGEKLWINTQQYTSVSETNMREIETSQKKKKENKMKSWLVPMLDGLECQTVILKVNILGSPRNTIMTS